MVVVQQPSPAPPVKHGNYVIVSISHHAKQSWTSTISHDFQVGNSDSLSLILVVPKLLVMVFHKPMSKLRRQSLHNTPCVILVWVISINLIFWTLNFRFCFNLVWLITLIRVLDRKMLVSWLRLTYYIEQVYSFLPINAWQLQLIMLPFFIKTN